MALSDLSLRGLCRCCRPCFDCELRELDCSWNAERIQEESMCNVQKTKSYYLEQSLSMSRQVSVKTSSTSGRSEKQTGNHSTTNDIEKGRIHMYVLVHEAAQDILSFVFPICFLPRLMRSCIPKLILGSKNNATWNSET